MDEEEFAKELIKRHNSTELGSEVLKDIRGVVRNITDAKRKELFDWYRENWRSSACPRAAFFADRLRDTGQKATYGSDRITGAWICGNCGTKYSMASQACPRCGSDSVKGIFPDGAHPAIVEVKTDCWTCSVYHDEGGQKYGPECEHWGDGSRPYDHCRECRCKACCAYEHQYRRGTAGNKMPWLDPDYWRKYE